MKLFSLKNTLTTAAVTVFAFVLAGPVLGQNTTEEYREWQRAQREAREELRDYRRSGDRDDLRDYRQANRQAQREYREYINSRNRNTRYYNNGRVVVTSRPYYPASNWYRVYNNGRYYRINNRSAEMLQRAVNMGYQQGYYEGQRDRQYRDGYSYYDESQYRSGMYGYSSYVDNNLYQHYFRQGFQRGYEDGYRSTYRYGYRSNTGLNILGNVLGTILQLAVDND